MSTTREGIAMHRILYTFEKLAAGLLSQGVEKRTADRVALMTAMRLEGWPEHETHEYVDTWLPHLGSQSADDENH